MISDSAPMSPVRERAPEYAPMLERVIHSLDEGGKGQNAPDWPSPEFWDKVRKLSPAGRSLLVEKLNAQLEQIRRDEELTRQAEAIAANSLRLAAAELGN
jgi:hypothetical protein